MTEDIVDMPTWFNRTFAATKGPRSSLALRITIFFSCFFSCALVTFSFLCYRHPASLFSNPTLDFNPGYSAHRQKEAVANIVGGNHKAQSKTDGRAIPKICLGIASVARNGSRYFKNAVGSVVEGLDKSERKRLHLILS